MSTSETKTESESEYKIRTELKNYQQKTFEAFEKLELPHDVEM
jgi:hypothetical protein